MVIFDRHRKEWEASAIAHHQLTDCLEILEDIGIPMNWGIKLLPLIQFEMGGDA